MGQKKKTQFNSSKTADKLDTMTGNAKKFSKPTKRKFEKPKANADHPKEPKSKKFKKLKSDDESSPVVVTHSTSSANGKKSSVNTKSNTSEKRGKAANHSFKKKGPLHTKKEKPKVEKLSNKDAHSKAKSLREERRQKDRSHYDLTVEMKKLWEDLRRLDLAKDKRAELCQKIMTMVKGKERDFVFAHDTTRVFQSLGKYAPPSIRSELFQALKGSVLEMAKSKYSAFFVRVLLRKGTREEKDFIIGKLMDNARKLITHKIAGPIAEFAYNEFANAGQRQMFAQQFYGPYFKLTAAGEKLPLSQLLSEKPEKKQYILKYMKEALESIVQKQALSYTFIHNLLYEYFTYAGDIEKQAMAECLQEHVAHIVHTREGAKAGMYCVWNSSAKGRKVIIKQIKPFLDKLLTEEYGHMILFAIFDSVDDTKLVSKLILTEIGERLENLVQDKWGRHVLLYLLKPRDPQCVNKEIKELLSLGDSNPFSKKDLDVRQRELLEQISPALLSYTADNLEVFLETNSNKVLLFSILKNTVGDKSPLFNSLVGLYNEPYSSDHPLDNKPLHMNVQKAIANDDTGVYARCFIDGISGDIFKTFAASDQGCYFLACLINSAAAEDKDQFVKMVTGYRNIVKKSKQNRPQEALLKLLV